MPEVSKDPARQRVLTLAAGVSFAVAVGCFIYALILPGPGLQVRDFAVAFALAWLTAMLCTVSLLWPVDYWLHRKDIPLLVRALIVFAFAVALGVFAAAVASAFGGGPFANLLMLFIPVTCVAATLGFGFGALFKQMPTKVAFWSLLGGSIVWVACGLLLTP